MECKFFNHIGHEGCTEDTENIIKNSVVLCAFSAFSAFSVVKKSGSARQISSQPFYKLDILLDMTFFHFQVFVPEK